MSIEIQWEEPPGRAYSPRPDKYGAVKAALKANPGRSAVVFHGKSANTSWWKDQGFEATSRQQEDGTVKTYACWPVGKDPEDTTPVGRNPRRSATTRQNTERRTACTRPAAAENDQPVPTVVKPAPKTPAKKPAAAKPAAAGKPLVSQRPRTPRPSTAAKTPPTGAIAADEETTGTCTRCRAHRQVGVQDHLCRKCRLNDAIRRTR